MRSAYSVEQVRALEAAAISTVGDDALMQRAAHGLAVAAGAEIRRLRGHTYGSAVLVLVGPGNNGGDALFAGARLARRGCRVLAVRALGTPHAGGLAALLTAGGRVVELDALGPVAGFDLALDGVLGIGGRAGLPDPVADLVERLADAAVPVVAVDLPSGVAADSGAVPAAAVTASRTVTFGTLKPLHLLEPARSRCGQVSVVDIGLDTDRETAATAPALLAWDPADVAAAWPVPGPVSDKYARGVVGVDTGSEQYPGAAILSTHGVVYGGAGMVRFSGPDAARPALHQLLPNVVYGEGRVQAWLLGSGWGERADGRERVAAAVDSGLPVVVDADGLQHLPDRVPDRVLLTPHAGELARLLDRDRPAVEADPVDAVRTAADRTGATVLLKGATQLVAVPGGASVDVAVPGPAWTGQAGSGDVLGGLCAALLAAGLDARTAAACAASAQAMTATAHPGPRPPQDLVRLLADLVGGFDRPEQHR